MTKSFGPNPLDKDFTVTQNLDSFLPELFVHHVEHDFIKLESFLMHQNILLLNIGKNLLLRANLDKVVKVHFLVSVDIPLGHNFQRVDLRTSCNFLTDRHI